VDRISIVGNSGCGKSTLAARLAERLGVPHLELDAVFHQPGWTELDLATFQSRVRDFAAQPAWVIDGNYRSRLDDAVWQRADTVVWLDYPRWIVMSRVLRRTFRRLITRAQLWNGNRESLRNILSWDPDTSILRWAWTQHHAYREGYGAELSNPAHAALTFVRLRRPRDTERWLADLEQHSGVE
jgi:adenylate kinase family enzyme